MDTTDSRPVPGASVATKTTGTLALAARRISGFVLWAASERRFAVGVGLHLERLKSLCAQAGPPTVAAAAASPRRRRRRSRRRAPGSGRDRRVVLARCGDRGSSAFSRRGRNLAARPQRKLKVRSGVARRRTERDRAFCRAESRQLRGQAIGGVGREEDGEFAVGIGGRCGLQGVARVHNDGHAGQRVAAAGDVPVDTTRLAGWRLGSGPALLRHRCASRGANDARGDKRKTEPES